MKNGIILCGIILFLVLNGCSDEPFDGSGNLKIDESECAYIKADPDYFLKKEFSSALAHVLADNKDVRLLIKNEALKKINHDYDVLYYLIKDKVLSNGFTLKQELQKYIESDKLEEIELKLPTLTIFVPRLPFDSFSADKWDIEKDIPVVGLRIWGASEVPVFNNLGESWTIAGNQVPITPTVVVKINERIIVDRGMNSALRSSYGLNSGLNFAFLDDEFDNINTLNTRATPERIYSGSGTENDPYVLPGSDKILRAYDIYGTSSSGWQRDYIYYDISPTSPKGPFNYSFQEYLVGFELIGDGFTAANHISDQTGDPKQIEITRNRAGLNYWTDGQFEFKVKIYIGNKNGTGMELVKFFRCEPEDLFKPKWRATAERPERDENAGSGGHINRPSPSPAVFEGFTCRKVELALPLFEWNLENISSQIKIAFEEVDPSQTITTTQTWSYEFATNFSVTTTSGDKVKVGTTYGTSTKQTTAIQYQVTTSMGNDLLGEELVNFADPIILNRNTETIKTGSGRTGYVYYSNLIGYQSKYNTGYCKFYIAPVKNY